MIFPTNPFTYSSTLPPTHLLVVNCWPTVNSDGSCDVNIDYELSNTALALQDVVITVPLPAGSGAPVIGSCDGEYAVDT